MKTNRLILAFLIAPISFTVVVGLFMSVLAPSEKATAGFLWAVILSAMIGYPLAILVGSPLYFLMQKLNLRGLISYSLASLIIAFPLMFMFALLPAILHGSPELDVSLSSPRLRLILWILGVSLFNVVVFWLIARPDLDK